MTSGSGMLQRSNLFFDMKINLYCMIHCFEDTFQSHQNLKRTNFKQGIPTIESFLKLLDSLQFSFQLLHKPRANLDHHFYLVTFKDGHCFEAATFSYAWRSSAALFGKAQHFLQNICVSSLFKN